MLQLWHKGAISTAVNELLYTADVSVDLDKYKTEDMSCKKQLLDCLLPHINKVSLPIFFELMTQDKNIQIIKLYLHIIPYNPQFTSPSLARTYFLYRQGGDQITINHALQYYCDMVIEVHEFTKFWDHQSLSDKITAYLYLREYLQRRGDKLQTTFIKLLFTSQELISIIESDKYNVFEFMNCILLSVGANPPVEMGPDVSWTAQLQIKVMEWAYEVDIELVIKQLNMFMPLFTYSKQIEIWNILLNSSMNGEGLNNSCYVDLDWRKVSHDVVPFLPIFTEDNVKLFIDRGRLYGLTAPYKNYLKAKKDPVTVAEMRLAATNSGEITNDYWSLSTNVSIALANLWLVEPQIVPDGENHITRLLRSSAEYISEDIRSKFVETYIINIDRIVELVNPEHPLIRLLLDEIIQAELTYLPKYPELLYEYYPDLIKFHASKGRVESIYEYLNQDGVHLHRYPVLDGVTIITQFTSSQQQQMCDKFSTDTWIQYFSDNPSKALAIGIDPMFGLLRLDAIIMTGRWDLLEYQDIPVSDVFSYMLNKYPFSKIPERFRPLHHPIYYMDRAQMDQSYESVWEYYKDDLDKLHMHPCVVLDIYRKEAIHVRAHIGYHSGDHSGNHIGDHSGAHSIRLTALKDIVLRDRIDLYLEQDMWKNIPIDHLITYITEDLVEFYMKFNIHSLEDGSPLSKCIAKTSPECAVCMDPMVKGTRYMLPCKHMFHVCCVKQWIETQDALLDSEDETEATCPLCRAIF